MPPYFASRNLVCPPGFISISFNHCDVFQLPCCMLERAHWSTCMMTSDRRDSMSRVVEREGRQGAYVLVLLLHWLFDVHVNGLCGTYDFIVICLKLAFSSCLHSDIFILMPPISLPLPGMPPFLRMIWSTCMRSSYLYISMSWLSNNRLCNIAYSWQAMFVDPVTCETSAVPFQSGVEWTES